MGKTLIFVPSKEDEENDYYHVVFCESNFYLRVKKTEWTSLDIVQIAFYNELLIVGSQSELLIYDLSHHEIEEMIKSGEKELVIEEVE